MGGWSVREFLLTANRLSDWSRVHAVVAGLGVSGYSAADGLLSLGARVTVLDESDTHADKAAILETLDATVRLGKGATAELPGDTDLVVTSPGWRPDTPLLTRALERGIPVWGDIELAWRMQQPDRAIPWLGVTGTNGKTTTKELLSAVLAEKYNVMHTEGNFNNDIGVPKTLLRLRPEHQIAVIEMGASHPGDIKKLVEYAEPTCGLITNVGRAHLQGFGSFEGVRRTKGELYDFLKTHEGLTFLNTSNSYLVEMARQRGLERIISYGQDAQANVQGRVVGADPFLRIEWTADGLTFKVQPDEAVEATGKAFADGPTMQVQSHLIGTYNLDNILAAITVGLHFGVTPARICHALEHYVPANNRSQLTTTADNWLIVDAYNANPTSMAAAISNFIHISVAQPKVAILGDMRELGAVSGEEHQKIVDSLARAGLDDVWLVGDEFMKTRCSFRKFRDVEEVKAAIRERKPRGHYILIKGSNGIRLFELPELL